MATTKKHPLTLEYDQKINSLVKKENKIVKKLKKVPEVKMKKEPLIIKEINKIRAKEGKGLLLSKDGELYTAETNPNWDKEWENIPDSQDTVEQKKSWDRFAPQGDVDETPVNYWKYACIFILLGVVTGMVLSTPLFIKLADICTQ